MAWSKRNTGELLVLGDANGQVRKAGGLLVGVRKSSEYDNFLFDFVKQNGDTVAVAGSTTINNVLGPRDIGKFVKIEFLGWGQGKSGRKFKDIDVQVWDGEPTDDMRAWPRYHEFQNSGAVDDQTHSDDRDAAYGVDEEDDDLPF